MLYHPFEIGIVGYSGSGKTTLVAKLRERLKSQYRVGYYKHDAHKFFMDKPGKDTHIAREAGAESVYINDKTHAAFIRSGEPSQELLRSLFLDMDLLLVEGRKHSPIPKLFLLDPRGEAEALFESPSPPENLMGVVGPGERPDFIPPGVPFRHRDDIAGISWLLEAELGRRLRATPLNALILAGGQSSRMGGDKAFIRYHGVPELERLAALTESRGLETRISCRPDQIDDPRLQGLSLLPDSFLDCGPMSGILTALHAQPSTAWLVLSCDMPLFDGRALDTLLRRRNPFRVATAYLEPENELPEPLAAIWEPKSRSYLHSYLADGRKCPRKLLSRAPIEGVVPVDPEVLRNVNQPAERDEVIAELSVAEHGTEKSRAGEESA